MLVTFPLPCRRRCFDSTILRATSLATEAFTVSRRMWQARAISPCLGQHSIDRPARRNRYAPTATSYTVRLGCSKRLSNHLIGLLGASTFAGGVVVGAAA